MLTHYYVILLLFVDLTLNKLSLLFPDCTFFALSVFPPSYSSERSLLKIIFTKLDTIVIGINLRSGVHVFICL